LARPGRERPSRVPGRRCEGRRHHIRDGVTGGR
jgi:hypothetical protein